MSRADGSVVASLSRLSMFGFTAGSFGVEFLWYCILVCEYLCCLLSSPLVGIRTSRLIQVRSFFLVLFEIFVSQVI